MPDLTGRSASGFPNTVDSTLIHAANPSETVLPVLVLRVVPFRNWLHVVHVDEGFFWTLEQKGLSFQHILRPVELLVFLRDLGHPDVEIVVVVDFSYRISIRRGMHPVIMSNNQELAWNSVHDILPLA